MSKQKHPAFKVAISGTYRNSKKEYLDFENVHGVIPACDKELAEAMIRRRYAEMWVREDKRYKEQPVTMREVFIDSIEETEANFSVIGKNIAELSYEELQDLATLKDLRGIPLYKKGGLRQARNVAYAEYATKVLGRDVDHRETSFNLVEQPVLLVDAEAERNLQKQFTNDEILQMEQKKSTSPAPKFSREELEAMAMRKNIIFNEQISDQKLQQKIFNAS